MLVKRPSREAKYIKFMKYIIGFEIACFGLSYIVWKRMNVSQEFRYYMHNNAPIILNTFYAIGRMGNPNYNLEKIDKQYWDSQE